MKCYDTVKTVCANNLHNITDCRNCKGLPGAWAKLLPACAGRPINNFHEACEAFFPAKIPMRGSLVEVLIGQGGADGSTAFCVEPALNGTQEYCPPWAGSPAGGYNRDAGKWFQVSTHYCIPTRIIKLVTKLPEKRFSIQA